ncbi:hypothetical protein [Sphaerisporangium aureirubrum]|uniref:Alpha/beta hydrolase n=1 Tax=Sphaerisporangium aureirubrum TaxID=1544736 RepID=A0ABW1NNQ7_9ACTN
MGRRYDVGGRRLYLPGHSTLHTERPDAVVQAIRDLVGRVTA